MKINPEVKKALEENRPVVALESTIISHGMPYRSGGLTNWMAVVTTHYLTT